MHIGRMHDDGQQEPQRIDDDMTLTAFDFLELVEASLGPGRHRRLDRLAIDRPGTGAGLASGSAADDAPESMHHAFDQALAAPLVLVVAHERPRGQVFGDLAPLTACFDEVEEGVGDFAYVVLSFAFAAIFRL